MQYTLIIPKGKVYTFFLKVVAETYQQAYGGTIMSKQILDTICPEMANAV